MTGMSSADRIQAAWVEISKAYRTLTSIDFSGIDGLTADERRQALELFAEEHALEFAQRGRLVDQWAFLAKHAPGLTIAEAVARLTPEERDEYDALGEV